MKISRFILIITAVSLFVAACEKSGSVINNEDINLADDDAVAEAMFDDIFNSADNATLILENYENSLETVKGGVVTLVSDSCPAVTVEIGDDLLRVITIDYGEGCTGFYNQTRSGKIVITLDGKRRVEGSTRTVTFDNYFFNGIKVEGIWVTTNEGLNENLEVVFSISLTGGKMTFPDGTVVERSLYHERSWIAGFNTREPWDDECLVTGYASGVTYRGISYQNEITTALHWKRICPFFVSGVISITRDDAEPIELNYGEGECDEYATLTKGDEVREIILKKRHRILR